MTDLCQLTAESFFLSLPLFINSSMKRQFERTISSCVMQPWLPTHLRLFAEQRQIFALQFMSCNSKLLQSTSHCVDGNFHPMRKASLKRIELMSKNRRKKSAWTGKLFHDANDPTDDPSDVIVQTFFLPLRIRVIYDKSSGCGNSKNLWKAWTKIPPKAFSINLLSASRPHRRHRSLSHFNAKSLEKLFFFLLHNLRQFAAAWKAPTSSIFAVTFRCLPQPTSLEPHDQRWTQNASSSLQVRPRKSTILFKNFHFTYS